MNLNVASLNNMFTEELDRLKARMAETEQQRRVKAAELRMLEEENRQLRESHEHQMAELHSLEREILMSEASLQREVVEVRQMPLLEAPPEELKV